METILAKIKFLLPRRVRRVLERPYHFLLAYAAALVFGFPSRRMIVIGVTGTKGKTTTVRLLHEILAASGMAVASASSLEFRIGGAAYPNTLKMTMPGRFVLQRFLRRAVRAGCRYAVVEVTSQGIVQYRHRGIRFAGGIMTNMAPEHLEAHGGFEPYLRAKLDLFWRLPKEGIAVMNRDDAQASRFAAATPAHRAWYGKNGITIGGREWRIAETAAGRDGISFSVGGTAMRSPLLGMFNFYNILAAITVGLSEGMTPERIARALAGVSGVAGRMEFVAREPAAVVVDYAHTPDSLKNVYAFLRGNSKRRKGKLLCVLGSAGGGRDRWKRKEFGRIAAEYCDNIILTNEDPYDENPLAILEDIESGFSQIPKFAPSANSGASPVGSQDIGFRPKFQIPNLRTVLDRREAIGAALAAARPGDTVVITGKGAEPWLMGPGGAKIPWDDRRVVREELARLRGTGAFGITTP